MKRYIRLFVTVIICISVLFASATIILAMGSSPADHAQVSSVDPKMAVCAAAAAAVVGIVMFFKRNHIFKS